MNPDPLRWHISLVGCEAMVIESFTTARHYGAKGQPGFARNADWRVEADRLLAQAKHKD